MDVLVCLERLKRNRVFAGVFAAPRDRAPQGSEGRVHLASFEGATLLAAMNRQPIGRLGTAEEMAELAAFLMSREGENIVGQTILSCGGSTY